MRKIIFPITFLSALFILFSLASQAEAATRTRGYFKPSTGSYVEPYYRSSPNSTRWDNYSTKGNSNPFTGKKGYANPYGSYRWR